MSDQIISCPNCKTNIKLNESLAAPLIESVKKEFEQKLLQKDEEVTRREEILKKMESQINEDKRTLDVQIANKLEEQLKSERAKFIEEETRKIKLLSAAEIESKSRELQRLSEVLKLQDEKLAEAQRVQAEFIKKQRELDDQKRELDLTVEVRVQNSLQNERTKAKLEAEEGLKLKIIEREQMISSMQQTIEELKRRSEQGSQQLQGEVQEIELENLLKANFPFDSIEPVAKGEFGGDALQKVVSQSGSVSGSILWESKRTKTWQDVWLSKLRDDKRTANADIAIIVTRALPKEVQNFDIIDGVWVVSYACALPVAKALRNTLLQVNLARQISQGTKTKSEMVYQYLTSSKFKQRVEAIVEAFSSMREDLDKEKKAITKLWSKREAQIERVTESTIGMWGDLEGICGKSLQEIEGLELDKIEVET